MKFKIIFLSVVFSFLLCSFALGQITLGGLMDKVANIEVENRSKLDILNQVTTEGELDTSVPKRTITTGGELTETVFVFDFGAEHEGVLEELQQYFVQEENFEVINRQEQDDVEGVELQSGSTYLSLVKKGSIVVEVRSEGFLLAPELSEEDVQLQQEELEAQQQEAQEEQEGQVSRPPMPSWAWAVIAGIIVAGAVLALVKKVIAKKK